jgi:glyoxylase-like metal-dependent hydrolase (beta-lactamase superfamily II)
MTPLPPVEQVRPGLWSIPVPLPMNSLRYVLVYAFETDRGAYLIDAGWNTADAFAALETGLQTAGFAMSDVRGVMVTHIHPDHYGLAGRIRAASDAWISLHPADAALIETRYIDMDDLLPRVRANLQRAGAPADVLDELKNASMPVRPFVDAVKPDVLLEDGDKPDVPGWDLTAIWTPGHSPGHLCFYVPSLELMLTGDHVLPRITPNVSAHPQSGDNPLGDFLTSLDKVAAYDTTGSMLALPAHEHRFVGLSARTSELRAHHQQRFNEIATALHDGIETAWEVASRMSWSRSWSGLDHFMRRAALGEAMAHLLAMRAQGIVRDIDGVPVRWELTEQALHA